MAKQTEKKQRQSSIAPLHEASPEDEATITAFKEKMQELLTPERLATRRQVMNARSFLIQYSQKEIERTQKRSIADHRECLDRYGQLKDQRQPRLRGQSGAVRMVKFYALAAGTVVPDEGMLKQLTFDFLMPPDEAKEFVELGKRYGKVWQELQTKPVEEEKKPEPAKSVTCDLPDDRQLPSTLHKLLENRWIESGSSIIRVAAERPNRYCNPLSKSAVVEKMPTNHLIHALFNGKKPCLGETAKAKESVIRRLETICDIVDATPEERQRVMEAHQHDCDYIDGQYQNLMAASNTAPDTRLEAVEVYSAIQKNRL